MRVEVEPEMLVWARQRSGLTVGDLGHRFPRLADWERGERLPTLKQLESYAQATHTPVGFLFLSEPPAESIPIPDFRTMGDVGVRRASPDLLETIYLCEQRQEWYRDFAQLNGEEPVAAVGSLDVAVPVVDAASVMRSALRFSVGERGGSWSDAFRLLAQRAEDLGVLVMVSGVVGSNTHRRLDPAEFRGFALVDDRAPLVFLNGADTKAAQIFTLVHELAHVWIGGTALDDIDPAAERGGATERWCNQVAAEVLLPLAAGRDDLLADEPLTDKLERVARRYKVSTLVVLRRVHDAGGLTWDAYRTAYRAELDRIMGIVEARGGRSGGNFFNTQPARVSRRFARAVVTSTLEGQTLHRDAFRMLGLKKATTFQEMAARLGTS
ncbi:helix-turn-helix domain-containing protein [Acidiferrimicrobium sp. IK]|uniref:helix-turn-helix domain-containing protein n=1 Tax=Acidiferrimicrobium sp. IK TaxID=2871700 RepID=UPI0021CB4DF6|nr:XRE family transcriptional regulator [Acidiferrimicrobium sp. IK]